jgi:peptidoglycan/LPS O-acetylase OafA/YrhL
MFLAPFWQMLGVTVGLSIVVAAASWYLVERPALRFKDGFRAGLARKAASV